MIAVAPFAPAVMMLRAPVVGIDPATPNVLHRIDIAGCMIRPRPIARCGTPVTFAALDEQPIRWADVRTRGTSAKRCGECK